MVGYLCCCPCCWVGVCEAGLRGWACCWYQLVASLELPVPSCPPCTQKASLSAVSSWGPWHRALGSLGILQLLHCSGPSSSGQFGISSAQWILEPGQRSLPLCLSCMDVMSSGEHPAIQRSLGCFLGDSIITGVFWDKECHFQVHELSMKVFRQHPALVGWDPWQGRGPSQCLPPSLPGASGSAWFRGLDIAPVRDCSGPVPECPHHRLALGGVS